MIQRFGLLTEAFPRESDSTTRLTIGRLTGMCVTMTENMYENNEGV